MNTLDLQGYWWLPEHDDHRVPGALHWTLESGGELDLLGELVPPVRRDNMLADGSIQEYREGGSKVGQVYPAIYGGRTNGPTHSCGVTASRFGDSVLLTQPRRSTRMRCFGVPSLMAHMT